MLAIEKWAQGKNPFIGMCAPLVAAFASDLYDIYANCKNHKISSSAKEPPDLPTWYSLYRNHQRYFDVMGNFILNSSILMQEMVNVGTQIDELREDIKKSSRKLTAEESIQLQGSLKKLYKSSFDEIRSDMEDTPLTDQQNDVVNKYFKDNKTELFFCFFVCTPCLMFYKINPSRLYHRACLGDLKAIDALLRLDPLMLHDPAVGKQIQKIRLSGKRTTYINLIEAPLKPLKAKINRNRVKAMLGSFISIMAAELGAPLTSTDIRKLFDAIAQDARKQEFDTSLPNSDEAFYKNLQRSRDDWKKVITAGQKKVKVVSG